MRPFYRALTPSWAYQLESGAGAALAGGRFNRPNVEARYLAATPEAALAEYQGESALLPPATLATYQAEAVVDFTGGYDAERWSPIWTEANGNWKGWRSSMRSSRLRGVIGDLVREAGFPGILYRCARVPAHHCLVLFPELFSRFRAPVFDPEGRLPRNAESWRPL
jgi:RES domain-containing protein